MEVVAWVSHLRYTHIPFSFVRRVLSYELIQCNAILMLRITLSLNALQEGSTRCARGDILDGHGATLYLTTTEIRCGLPKGSRAGFMFRAVQMPETGLTQSMSVPTRQLEVAANVDKVSMAKQQSTAFTSMRPVARHMESLLLIQKLRSMCLRSLKQTLARRCLCYRSW